MPPPDQAVLEVPDEPEQPRKKKRRIANPDAWQQNTRKHKREKESRTLGNRTRKKLFKVGTVLKARCSCKKAEPWQCAHISEESRQEIFNNVWKEENWGSRKVYVYMSGGHSASQKKSGKS